VKICLEVSIEMRLSSIRAAFHGSFTDPMLAHLMPSGRPPQQMGFAEQALKQGCGMECLCTTRGFLFIGSTVCHLLLSPLRHGDDERSGGLRHVPESRAVRHHGPHRAGHFVRQRHRCHFARPAFQQFQQPGARCLAAPLGITDDRCGSHDQ
jgi:hypothetical protein